MFMHPTIDPAPITWKGKHGVACISDFGDAFSQRWVHLFHIKSPRTGAGKTFELTRTERDREGEILAWHFWASDDHSITIELFND